MRPRTKSATALGRYSTAHGLEILCAHYGVAVKADGSHWRRVLEELATDCFPYFKHEAKLGGRPRVWTDSECVRLVQLVRAERRKNGRTIEQACEALRDSHFPKTGVEKLVDHYQEGHRLLRKRAKDRARRRFLHRVGATRRTVLSGWVDRK